MALLASDRDSRFPADLISQLLLQMRLQEAMSVASMLLETSEDNPPVDSYGKLQKSALVQAKRRNHGEDFVKVAGVLVNHNMKQNSAEAYRLIQSLYSFLLKWDPVSLPKEAHRAESKQVAQDDIDLHGPFCSAQTRIHRRPSACPTATDGRPLELLCMFRDLKQVSSPHKKCSP